MATLPTDELAVGDGSGRNLPNGDGLARACLRVELTAVEHAPVLARNRDNSYRARTQVAFWNGPASTTIPLRYRLTDTTDTPVPVASGSSATGSFQTSIQPGSIGTRVYELTVDLGAGAVLSAFFDRRTETLTVRERLELQARRLGASVFTDSIGSVAPGSAVQLRIRLAGDDTAGKTITITHDGGGTVPATARTDASGEALVGYVAPATAQIEFVSATISDGGLTTGDAVVITTREPIIVTVTPSFSFTNAGGSVQFSATVTGTADQRVSWNVSGGGTISSTGRFTAGATAGTFAITATSVEDPQSRASAFVQVVSASLAGFWSGPVTDRHGEVVGLGPVRVQVFATPVSVPWFGFVLPFHTPGRFVLKVLEPDCGTGTLFLVEVSLQGDRFEADIADQLGCIRGSRVIGTLSGNSLRLELLSQRQLDGSRPLIFTYALTRE